MRKRVSGSFTLEAAFIVPVIIFAIVGLIWVIIYLYNSVKLTADADMAAFMTEKEFEQVINSLNAIFSGLPDKMSRSSLPPIVGSSVGIGINEGSIKEFEVLYQQTDKALYYSKEHGKNRYQFSEQATE